MITLENYYENFKEGILLGADAKSETTSKTFFNLVCDELAESGDITVDYYHSEYYKTGMETAGYDYDDERKQLTLFVCEIFLGDDIETLKKSTVDTKLKRAETFFEKSIKKLYENLEETSDEFQMSHDIYQKYMKKEIEKVKLILLTNGKLTKTIQSLKSKESNGIKFEYSIIDIEYLYKSNLSNYVENDIVLDVDIPCLKVSNSNEYESFLAVINGETICNIYENLGKRVLDENVRTFLQFKGNVNKGIRNTIEHKPEYFFAYNNGITATAKEVVLNENKDKIVKITNLQIVNGGQTTSSIYRSKIDHDKNISNIFVQMKLSLVKNNNDYSAFVQNISRFANTQNKVDESDLFSNHEFHRDYSSYSRRTWAPPKENSIKKTRWFYERVRGEYLNDLTNEKSVSKKKVFQAENPKPQVINKVLLAKSENLWNMFPVEVSKGAQYSFKKFAESIVKEYEKNEEMITETYFKNTVSRVIIFKELERIIKNADWYSEYRSQTIAYTVSYLAHYLKENKIYFNFNTIWESQGIYDKLEVALEKLAKNIYEIITNPPPGSKNIGEWCKKVNCWNAVKESNIKIVLPSEYILEKEEKKEIVKREKKEKKEEKKLDYLIIISEVDQDIWIKLFYHYSKYNEITEKQLDLVAKMASDSYLEGLFYPTDLQAKQIYEVYKKAKKEGVL